MFGMSFTEIMLILVIVLVFLGPEKIPDVARFVGKTLREVRKASNLLRDAVMIDDLDAPPRRHTAPATNAAVAHEALDQPDDVPRDPDPIHDIRVVMMNPRKASSQLSSITLSAAKPEMPHREVYLHIPYEETI